MMEKRIKYIAAFDLDENRNENRLNTLSSTNKINYIITVLNELGYGVDVISTSQTLNKQCYSGKLIKWGENTLRLFPTTWRGGFFLKVINALVMRFAISIYLYGNIQKGDIVIVYHSSGHLWIPRVLKKKGARLIEECEEIYGDIFGKPKLAERERKDLQGCYAYIYPTRLLNDVVNKEGAPYLVIHGAYKDVGATFFDDEVCDEPSLANRNIYHIAYTGILDPKKGCIEVVKAAEFLDDSFHIHILGFGNDDELRFLNNTIEDIKKKTKCEVTYDGLRKGSAYTNYLSKINLGVCTLNTEQGFIATQFPSKIISYMAAGSPVLCSDVEAIKTSDVAGAITFYKGNTPKEIAEGMKTARRKGAIDSKQLLSVCHERFKKEIFELIK